MHESTVPSQIRQTQATHTKQTQQIREIQTVTPVQWLSKQEIISGHAMLAAILHEPCGQLSGENAAERKSTAGNKARSEILTTFVPLPPSQDVLSGIVVALASIPMSIAFANIAGLHPLVGIWSSVVRAQPPSNH